jgi:hypothetical protein
MQCRPHPFQTDFAISFDTLVKIQQGISLKPIVAGSQAIQANRLSPQRDRGSGSPQTGLVDKSYS